MGAVVVYDTAVESKIALCNLIFNHRNVILKA